MSEQNSLYQYLLLLGDHPLIFGHRLSELCGHGPSLETDIALTNISLDLFGQVRNYFQYAAELAASGKTEDDIAFLRYPHEYRNALLAEQPNTDFAWIITRQFLFDAYHLPLMEALTESRDERIAAIAAKSLKEVKYHVRFSSEWVKRLGDGTDVSHKKIQAAVNHLWPYAGEFWEETELEKEMKTAGIGADLPAIKALYLQTVRTLFSEATLVLPEVPAFHSGGKNGVHTEHLGHLLAELQYMQRAYPNMTW